MHKLQAEQGTDQWHNDRLGVVTGSEFNNVITTKQMKRAKSVYIYLLAAEAVTGEVQEKFFETEDTRRGNELEPEAVVWYEVMHNVDVELVGLCLAFEGARYGCSPDGLVGEDGGIEIKAPQLKTHLKYKTEGVVPDDYLHQVYGSLFVSKRDWWDFISYNTQSEPFVIRTTKDDAGYVKWAEKFEPILKEFLIDLEKIIDKEKGDE